jgi:alpha-1,6-mannosyltransferase
MMQSRVVQATVAALMLAGFVWLGYFTERTNFLQVFFLFLILFVLYALMLWKKSFSRNLRIALGLAVLFRLTLLFMTPNLTDDYFRFIWDGLFVASGSNPYLTMPSAYMHGTLTVPGAGLSIYERLNSPDYYSVYPPVCQYIFGLAARVFGANVLWNIITIRIFVLLAECGTLALLSSITRKLNTPSGTTLIYAFNPMVIIELTGNLHPEAFMIFFLLLAIYLLMREKQILSALSLGLAVGAKLVPLIFLPLLIKRLGLVKSLKYFGIVSGTAVILFIPFISLQSISNIFASLSLYFKVFEFNASIYYVARWIGYQITGYNVIAFSGTILAIISFLAIVIISYREKTLTWPSLFSHMLFCATVYLLFATTIHPWYLTPLIAFSVFSRYRYALVWSLLIVLSYSAYQTLPYSENLWLVALEYILLGLWLIYGFLMRKRRSADRGRLLRRKHHGLCGGTATATAGPCGTPEAMIAENYAALQKPIVIEIENCGRLLLNALQPQHLIKIAIVQPAVVADADLTSAHNILCSRWIKTAVKLPDVFRIYPGLFQLIFEPAYRHVGNSVKMIKGQPVMLQKLTFKIFFQYILTGWKESSGRVIDQV